MPALATREPDICRATGLSISGNHITDEGAASLAAATWFGQIRSINLNNNRIGDRGRKLLEAALPEGGRVHLRENTPPSQPIASEYALTILEKTHKSLLLSGQLSSASDEKFEVVHLEGDFKSLDPNVFYKAFGLDSKDPNQVINRTLNVASFWLKVSKWHENCGRGHEESQEIGTLLGQLKDVMGVVLGKDSFETDPMHPVYLVGITEDRQLVGLRSKVCWA
jgi:hypothetical protein